MAGDTERLIVALEARVREFERGFARASKTANTQFSAIERRAQRSAKQLETSLKGSTANINRMLAGIGVGISFNELRQFADTWTTAGNKIKAAAASTGVQVRSLEALKNGANEARVSIEDYADLYARLVRSAANVANSEQEIARVTNITAKAFKAGGASASEQAAGILQLGQALGSGVLQGDELRSLRENAPILAQAIADEFGVTVSALKDLGAEGALTSDRVFQAILKAQANVESQFNATNATIGDSFTRLKNNFTSYIGGLDESIGITSALSAGVDFLANNLDGVTKGAAAAAAVLLGRYVPGLARAALAQAAAVATNPWLLLATVIGGATAALITFSDEIKPVSGDLATLADYAAVLWDKISEGASIAANFLSEAFMAAVNFIADALGGAEVSFSDLWDFTKQIANNIINGFVFVYDTLVATFTKLPQAIAEATLDAVNGMIELIEDALNGVVSGVNAAIGAINSVAGEVGLELGTVGRVDLGRITNDFAGAGEAAGAAYAQALQNATRDRIGEALGAWRAEANALAENRLDTPETPASPGMPARPVVTPPTSSASSGGSGRAERDGPNALDREFTDLQQRIEALKAETAIRRELAGSIEEQEKAIEKARIVQDLMNAAQEAGVTITDQLKGRMNSVADAYILAADEAQALAQSQQEAAQRAQELQDAGKDALKGFINDLVNARSPGEALLNMLGSLSSKLLDMGMNGLLDQLFAPTPQVPQAPTTGMAQAAGGAVAELAGATEGLAGLTGALGGLSLGLDAVIPGLGSMASGLMGLLGSMGGGGAAVAGGGLGLLSLLALADGGQVRGPGTSRSDSIPAMLSNGEYVVNAQASKRYGHVLDAINSGKVPALATGGRIGNSLSNTYAPSINISTGQNTDPRVARQIAAAVGQALDQRKPDTFRKSSGQQLAELGAAMNRANTRNT